MAVDGVNLTEGQRVEVLKVYRCLRLIDELNKAPLPAPRPTYLVALDPMASQQLEDAINAADELLMNE